MLSGAKHLCSFPRGDSQKYSEILLPPCGIRMTTQWNCQGSLGLGSLFAAIHAARRRRLVHHDFAETWTERLELFPEPRRHILDGWIFQAGDFVEIGVVELL